MMNLARRVPSKVAYAAAVGVVAISGLGLANAARPQMIADTTTSDGVTFGGNVRMNGSGCPGGSATMDVSPDGSVVTISYSQFTVQSGSGTSVRDRSKSCTTDIPVKVPTGISLSLLDVTYRGTSLGLDQDGVKATQSAKYWLAGSAVTAGNIGGSREIVPDGGAGDWSITDEFGALGINPGCKAANSSLRLTSTLQLQAPKNTEALASNDTTDVQSTALFRFAIRKCQV